jgi:hypothetical protein
MKRIKLYFVLGAAVLTVLAVAACSRDRSGPAGATGPAGRIADAVAEGAQVRATVHDAVELAGSARAQGDGTTQAAEAVVSGGSAVDPASGALLAQTERNGVEGERELRHTDADGHRHVLLLRGTPGRGPITSARYEKDGEVVAEVAWTWEARSGGWVLRARTIALHRHGRVMLRQVREASAVAVTGGGEGLGDVPEGGLSAPVQRMQSLDFVCGQEWANYIGASATLVIAGEVATILPNPVTTSAVLAAAAVWDRAFTALVACELRAIGAI